MIDWAASAPLSITTLIFNFVLTLVLATLLAWYYEHYGQSLANRRKFAHLMPMLSLTTALVITIVKSSLALSLGLVGALSIVRFRTAIKEPEELLFLFAAIAIGLGMGADQRWTTVIGTFVLLGYMGVRLLLQRRPPQHNLYLNIALEGQEEDVLFDALNTELLRHIAVIDFRRLDYRDGLLHLTYFVDCPDAEVLHAMVNALKREFPITEISFIQQDQLLGG